MGVMACDRRGCDHIGCSTLISNQYVCWSCVEEFRKSLAGQSLPEGELYTKFNDFMASEKVCEQPTRVLHIDEFLDEGRIGR